LSYTATSSKARTPRAVAGSSGSPNIVEINHLIQTEDGDVDANFRTSGEETVYRIAAILGAVVVGDADRYEAAVRITGILPERLPNGVSGRMMAESMLSVIPEGRSLGGTPAVRRSIEGVGLLQTSLVREAVAAARVSQKIKFQAGATDRAPIEWYVDSDGSVNSREFEPPSVRSRIELLPVPWAVS
jgi:hypothetical protein